MKKDISNLRNEVYKFDNYIRLRLLFVSRSQLFDVYNARQLWGDKFWHSLKENQKLIGSCLVDVRLLIRVPLPRLIVLWSQTLFHRCVERRRSSSNFSQRLNAAAPPKSSCNFLRKTNSDIFTFYSFRLMLKLILEKERLRFVILLMMF